MGSSVDFQRYRPCVGALVLNQENAIFTALRIDNPGNYWQMPQGGIEPGETPDQALRRELYEENAMVSVAILAENPAWLSYDLPPELREKLWNGRWVGQAQKWFALRFTGAENEINLQTDQPEFRAWKWTSPDRVLQEIVPFKRDLYKQVLSSFSTLWT